MALQQAVGAQGALSTTLPSTHDAAGVGALTYTNIGFMSTVPDLDGQFDVATFDNLTTGEEVKFADVFRAGEGSFEVGFDDADAGQAAIEGALGTKVMFRFTLKDGTAYHRRAVITSYMPTNITTGNVVMGTVNLAFEGKPIKVAA